MIEPFSLDIPDKPATGNSITKAELDAIIQTGLSQAKMRSLIN